MPAIRTYYRRHSSLEARNGSRHSSSPEVIVLSDDDNRGTRQQRTATSSTRNARRERNESGITEFVPSDDVLDITTDDDQDFGEKEQNLNESTIVALRTKLCGLEKVS